MYTYIGVYLVIKFVSNGHVVENFFQNMSALGLKSSFMCLTWWIHAKNSDLANALTHQSILYEMRYGDGAYPWFVVIEVT